MIILIKQGDISRMLHAPPYFVIRPALLIYRRAVYLFQLTQTNSFASLVPFIRTHLKSCFTFQMIFGVL